MARQGPPSFALGEAEDDARPEGDQDGKHHRDADREPPSARNDVVGALVGFRADDDHADWIASRTSARVARRAGMIAET